MQIFWCYFRVVLVTFKGTLTELWSPLWNLTFDASQQWWLQCTPWIWSLHDYKLIMPSRISICKCLDPSLHSFSFRNDSMSLMSYPRAFNPWCYTMSRHPNAIFHHVLFLATMITGHSLFTFLCWILMCSLSRVVVAWVMWHRLVIHVYLFFHWAKLYLSLQHPSDLLSTCC